MPLGKIGGVGRASTFRGGLSLCNTFLNWEMKEGVEYPGEDHG